MFISAYFQYWREIDWYGCLFCLVGDCRSAFARIVTADAACRGIDPVHHGILSFVAVTFGEVVFEH